MDPAPSLRRFRNLVLAGVVTLGAATVPAQDFPDEQSTTGPVPPPNVGPKTALRMAAGGSARVIDGVPGYKWRHGCGPTAVGMVLGYFDSHGFPNLFPGSAATQTDTVDHGIASQGSGTVGSGVQLHYEDYSLPKDSATLLPDRSEEYPAGCHTNDCIADFMHTSWSRDNNQYGWSRSSRVDDAFIGYVNLRDSAYAPQCASYGMGSSLTWSVLTNQINQNRPMVFLVDTKGDGKTDHFVTVVGYADGSSQQYGCLDTWAPYATIRWCEFRTMSTSYSWGVSRGWSFQLTPGPVLAVQPSRHDFGALLIGRSCDRTFAVTNSGVGTLSGQASVSPPFEIVSGQTYALAPGQPHQVAVRFEPKAPGHCVGSVTFTGGGGATCSVAGLALASLPTISLALQTSALRFEVAGQSDTAWRLEESSDMLEWVPSSSAGPVRLSQGQAVLQIPMPTHQCTYYRLVLIP